MKPAFFKILIGVTFIMSGCGVCVKGTGDPQPEDRILPEFTSIELNCSANVVIREELPSEKNKVVVEAQADLLPLIITRVSGKALKIDIEGCISTGKPITVYVYVNKLSEITSTGSGNVESDNIINADQFEIHNNSSGNIQAKLTANHVEVHLDGSGTIVLEGNTNLIEINNSGSGNCNAIELRSIEAEVNLNGSGAVSVFATKEMDLNLQGSGSIQYGGSPEKLNTKKDGSGEIHEAK